MKALVLGGSQFVGLHTVRELVERGHDVSVLNRGKTDTQLPPGVERLIADRRDMDSMRAALEGRDWDAVFDVSGFVMVAMGSSAEDLIELLDGHVGAYVFTSSIMVYRPTGVQPWDETFELVDEGANTYGGFKKVMEQALFERHARTGFPASVVRPAAIYGPDNNIYDMEAAYFRRLLEGRPIIVPHEGLVTGSYGHVDDLCRIMVDMATHPGAAGEAFNITGEAVTATHDVETLSEIVGRPAKVLHAPRRLVEEGLEKPAWGHLFGAFHHAVLDCSKARRVLGYRPEYDFSRGHAQTFEWFMGSELMDAETPPMDPLWFASYDFEWEAKVAERIEAEVGQHG